MLTYIAIYAAVSIGGSLFFGAVAREFGGAN